MILAATISTLFSGCAGQQYTDSSPSDDLRSNAFRSRTVTVSAAADAWRNSGVRVTPGSEYAISATGQWKAAASPLWHHSGPDGVGGTPGLNLGRTILPGVSYTMLIARIGDHGQPFSIGNQHVLRPSEAGLLYFRINEAGMTFDNAGQVQVTVRLVSHQEPERPHTTAPRQIKAPIARPRESWR
jgi:hypothetical protein